MRGITHTAQFTYRTLVVSIIFFPVISSWASRKAEELNELRERSDRILASLNGLDSRLDKMRSSISVQLTPKREVTLLDEELLGEDYESIPLPGDSEDKETPETVEDPTESGTIEWETYTENENESPEENWSEQDTEFEFVIEKYEKENPEISDDPDSFNSSDSTYRVVRSDYYVIFNYGIQLGSEIDFSSNALGGISGELETDTGQGMSLEFGYSFGMIEIGLLTGFNNQEISRFTGTINGWNTSNGKGTSSGEISNYYLALRPNLLVELSDSIDLRLGTSFGLSKKHINSEKDDVNSLASSLNNVLEADNKVLFPNPTFHEEKLCFLWDFHTTLQWALWENGGLLFGYRFAYVSGTGNFDSQIANSFEFGGRIGF